MSDNSTTRVHYFEGQFLRTQDFTDEQAYHVAMRRRHNISHHIWGIVSGLQIVIDGDNFYVQPGFAIDGYGRELILPQKTPLAPSAFTAKGSNELDVWLTYGLNSSDQPAAGFAGCGNGNATGESFYRSQEIAQIILERSLPEPPNRRIPDAVAISDRSFSAIQTPPDSPQSSWPVFLGQIIQNASDPKLVVNLDDRPYVGLVGETIYAPSGRTRVQVGSELADDTRRFAVFSEDDNTPPNLLPRFEVDHEGEVNVRGNLSIEGNLIMDRGAIEFEAGTARDPNAPAWNIYHFSDDEKGIDELRVEMAAAATPVGNNQVVIGAWFKGLDETGQEIEKFHPCLTVRDDCSVEIGGDLIIKGELHEGSRVGGELTEAARNAATAAMTSGLLATSARLPEIPDPPSNVLKFTAPVAEAVSPEAVAERVAKDRDFREAFAERMKTSHPDQVGLLSQALIIKP